MTHCFGKIRCVFLIRVFVFGGGRILCDISPQTEFHPNNILPAPLGGKKLDKNIKKNNMEYQGKIGGKYELVSVH